MSQLIASLEALRSSIDPRVLHVVLPVEKGDKSLHWVEIALQQRPTFVALYTRESWYSNEDGKHVGGRTPWNYLMVSTPTWQETLRKFLDTISIDVQRWENPAVWMDPVEFELQLTNGEPQSCPAAS